MTPGSVADPRNDRYFRRVIWEIVLRGPRHFWVLLFAQVGSVGRNYSLGASLFVLGLLWVFFVPFYSQIRGVGGDPPVLLNTLFAFALKRAWQHHQNRDFRRTPTDMGALDHRIMDVLRKQRVPERYLTEDWQWRCWLPLAMVVASFPLEWLGCPLLGSMTFVSAVFCFLLPGLYQALAEKGASFVWGDMMAQVNRLAGSSQPLQAAGAARVAATPVSPVVRESVIVECPHCGETVECDDDAGTILTCPCGQEFQLA